MEEKFFDVIATPKLMPEIVALALKHGIEASEPLSVDSVSDALDAPLGIDELRQAMEVVTLLAQTGTAVVSFLAALKAFMKNSEEEDGREPNTEIIETITRKSIGIISAKTDLKKFDI